MPHGTREQSIGSSYHGDATADTRLAAQYAAFRLAYPYRELDIGPVSWRYRVAGQGSQTLLLLPGGVLVPDLDFVLIDALAPEYRIIAPSYPPVQTMAALIAGAAAILDAECIAHVSAFGSSFGGYVAQCFVRHYPERVDQLILAQTGARHALGTLPVNATTVRLFATLTHLLPSAVIRFGIWRAWMRLLTTRPEERPFWVGLMRDILTTQLGRPHLLSASALIVDFIAHYHFTPADLTKWPGSILIMESDHDEAYDLKARALLRSIYPQAQVHTFENAGHTAVFSHSTEYISTIRSFLGMRTVSVQRDRNQMTG